MENLDSNQLRNIVVPKSHVIMLYQLANDVVRILDKHNIPYFIDGGTLLGAIRHKNLIPWDDDIDLGMFHKDFYRKLPKLRKEFEDLGYQIKECTNLYKIYIPDKWIYQDYKTVATPTLDIFPYIKKHDQIKLFDISHRGRWKKAVYNVKDMFPLREYEFGPIKLKGANNGRSYCDGLYPGWTEYAVVELRNGQDKSNTIKVPIDELFMKLQAL